MKKLREKISVLIAKDPKQMILLAIFGFNILFLLLSACVISLFAPSSVQNHGFWASVFYTITMILDAGCIQFVVEDVGQAGVGIIILCLLIVMVGMVTFTGAVIGYFTNYISEFINEANAGSKKLTIHDHILILNWNTRAVEILNDLLYSDEKEKVVVLTANAREKVEKEIEGRLGSTLQNENEALKRKCKSYPVWKRIYYYQKHKLRGQTVIVRQGDTYSTKDLMDASIENAKAVIILGRDINSSVCKFNNSVIAENREKGDAFTVKVLAQVAELTANEQSADEQKIIVEIEDDWTFELVQKIMGQKENLKKCNIIPVSVNRILGQMLSQFSIMPELNAVYSELFSNKGAAIYSTKADSSSSESDLVSQTLQKNSNIVPLTKMHTRLGEYFYWVANHFDEYSRQGGSVEPAIAQVQLKDYQMQQKNVIVIGHNSNSLSIMDGFKSFCGEWGMDALNILVIDSEKSLEKFDYYKEFPFVRQRKAADIYEKDEIYAAINSFVDANQNDTSILILSDDKAPTEDIDSNALTALIYVCDILESKMQANAAYDPGRMDIIVEILNPKHYDIVNRYGRNNIVISNRYISKMITQIGMKESVFEFYKDILMYDSNSADEFNSKEIYIKEVESFFAELPPQCSAYDLIRATYAAGPEQNKPILLGYVDASGQQTLFVGDQKNIQVALAPKDKLIVFCNH